jgi:hypothetical protein
MVILDVVEDTGFHAGKVGGGGPSCPLCTPFNRSARDCPQLFKPVQAAAAANSARNPTLFKHTPLASFNLTLIVFDLGD